MWESCFFVPRVRHLPATHFDESLSAFDGLPLIRKQVSARWQSRGWTYFIHWTLFLFYICACVLCEKRNTVVNIRKPCVLLNSTCLFLAQGSVSSVCMWLSALWSFCTLVTGPYETTRTTACVFFLFFFSRTLCSGGTLPKPDSCLGVNLSGTWNMQLHFDFQPKGLVTPSFVTQIFFFFLLNCLAYCQEKIRKEKTKVWSSNLPFFFFTSSLK